MAMQAYDVQANVHCAFVIRELAQKPHEPHAACGHCAEPRAEIKFEVTAKASRWKGSWIQGR
jgi:hypothetical protein